MNTPSKLNFNKNPSSIDDGASVDAMNIVLTDDYRAVKNENGFVELEVNTTGQFRHVGTIEIPDGFILFTFMYPTHTHPKGYNKITRYDKDGFIIKEITYDKYQFGIEYIVKGNYTFNGKGDLLITITQGVDSPNETLILNITTCANSLSDSDIYNMSLIPNIKNPTIIGNVIDDGYLKQGSYQICISYKIGDDYTNFTILNCPIYITNPIDEPNTINTIVNKSISLDITNLDDNYNKFKIAILHKLGDSELAYETDDISYTGTTIKYIIHDFSNLIDTSIADITIGNIPYIKDNTQTSFEGKLIRGNVKTISYEGLDIIGQNIANQIHVGLVSTTLKTPFEKDYSNFKYHKGGEQYLLYIGLIDYKGNMVNAYNIPYKEGDDTEPYIHDDPDIISHYIPQFPFANSDVYNITCSLRGNITELLKNDDYDFNNIITSYCYFYAVHDLTDSRILSQAFTIRGSDSNFEDQKYKNSFLSHEILNVYSFELLYNKQNVSDFYLRPMQRIRWIDDNDYNRDSDDSSYYDHRILKDNEGVEYIKFVNNINRTDFMHSSQVEMTDAELEEFINNTDLEYSYTKNNDSSKNNYGCESHGTVKNKDDSLDIKSPIKGVFISNKKNDLISPSSLFDKWFSNQIRTTNHYIMLNNNTYYNYQYQYEDNYIPRGIYYDDRMAVVDIVSKHKSFYNSIYDKQLVISSAVYPISNINNKIVTKGDFMWGNMSLRLTTPDDNFIYGDAGKDNDDYIRKLIVTVNIESRYNLYGRVNGSNTFENIYNYNKIPRYLPVDAKIFDTLFELPYKYDNFIKTDTGDGYNKQSSTPGYDYNIYTNILETSSHYPNRIIRSNVNNAESDMIGFRFYLTDNYKDVPISKGCINIIESDVNNIYIQQEHSLSIASVKNMLSNDKNSDTYLGASNIFDRPPTEIAFDKTGYISCDNRQSGIITPYGYIILDPIRKHIYKVLGTDHVRLDLYDTEIFFREHLVEGLTNSYDNNGYTILYDDIYKAIFITMNTGDDRSFTISYNFITNAFVSRHSYIPNENIKTKTNTFSITSNKLFKRNIEGVKGIYLDNIIHESYIDYIYKHDGQYNHFLSLTWDTLVLANNNPIWDQTISKIRMYNDTQCTGDLIIKLNDEWFDTENGVVRNDVWNYNDITDIVIDDKKPYKNADGSLILSNLNVGAEWFSLSAFIAKYLIIKFVIDNKFVNIVTGVRSEIKDTDNQQLEIILNDFDFNVTKSLL